MKGEQTIWETTPLRSLCLETTTIDPTKTPDKVFEYVDVSAISNELWKVVSSARHTEATAPSRARKLVRAEDVIFATVRPTLKRVALVPQDLDGQVVSTAFCVLRADRIKADPRFIYYSLLTEDFINRVSNLERGASYPAVTDNDVLQQEIVVPPLPEQRAIASVLSKIQKAAEVQEKIIATLKELKAATMAKLFREGLVRGFMFDTHIFDKILDGGIDISSLKVGQRLFVTHVQRDEIERCKDVTRRERLLALFEAIPQTKIPTESFFLGVSNLNEAKVSNDSAIVEEIRKGNPKHTEDALIAETCIQQNLILVTEERDLPKWVRKVGGEATTFEDFSTRRWRRVKQTEIGEIPESWEVVQVRDLAVVGNGSTPKRTNPAYWEGGTIPWLTSAKVHETFIRKADEFVTELAKKECHLPVVPKGSIVVAITGQGKTLGNAALITFDTCINQHLAYLHFQVSNVIPEFVLAFLQYKYQDLRQAGRAGGSTKAALTCRFLEAYSVPLPSVEEQKTIAQTICGMDVKMEGEKRRLDTFRNLFSSMLHLLMTGQVRVTQKMIALQALEERKKRQKKYSGKIEERKLEEIVRRIVETVQPEKIILFGSAARGEMGPDSDVDLLVIKSCANKRQTWEMIEKRLGGIGVPKDIVVATPKDVEHCQDIPGYVIRYALREGKVVYPS